MILQPTPPEREFISTVREFVAQNWRADATRPAGLLHELGAEAMTVAERNWFDALVGAGWSVPAWPLSAGGPGWSRTRQFLFARELAAAGAPLPLSVATEVVAPLLLAAGAGRVIFSGTGIRGLGRLIVIKHNERYLSVYAHNRELLVKEGQTVARGQKIAEMGDSDTDQVKLHFEIRRQGRPVDPASLLPPA